MKQRRPYHHGDLRRALLDATLELVAEHGSAAVTLREVARRAGVSQTAPYRHFPDRGAMLAAASEEGFRMLSALLLEAASPRLATAERRVIEWSAAYVRFAVAHSAYFRLMYGQGSPPKSTTVELQAAARETFQLLFVTLGELICVRRLTRNQHQLALQVWSIAHGIAMLAIEGQTHFLGVAPLEAAQQARLAVEVYLAGLLAPRPARKPRRAKR